MLYESRYILLLTNPWTLLFTREKQDDLRTKQGHL